MKKNHFGELVCTSEEYEILKSVLAESGVVLRWSATNLKEYECYVCNPYKQVVDGWGNDMQKDLAKEFFDRDNQ